MSKHIEHIVAAAQIRAEILDTAKHYVLKDRNATHGDPEDNFGRIAELWAAYKRVSFNATDVAAMMALMKVARIAQSPDHRDSWIDLAGYAACGAGIALQMPVGASEGQGDPEANVTRDADTTNPGGYREAIEAIEIAQQPRRGTMAYHGKG